MPNNTGMMNYILDNSIIEEQRSHADRANQRVRAAEFALANVTTDSDLRHWSINATRKADLAEVNVAKFQEELKQRDALLLEWMHSTEAFKRLAIKFGDKLGFTAGERKLEYQEAVMDNAEENPKFAGTRHLQKVKMELAEVNAKPK